MRWQNNLSGLKILIFTLPGLLPYGNELKVANPDNIKDGSLPSFFNFDCATYFLILPSIMQEHKWKILKEKII